MKVCAVILGGGSGSRMGAKQNKIFLPLRGVPLSCGRRLPLPAFARRPSWWPDRRNGTK